MLAQLASRAAVLVTSVLVIVYSAKRVVQQDREGVGQENDIAQQTLTWYHVIVFPIIASVMLLVLFYLFEYIQFIFTILTIIMSIGAVFTFILPFINQFTAHWTSKQKRLLSWVWCHSEALGMENLFSGCSSLVLVMLWVLSGHWLLLDFVGIAISVFMLQYIRVPSLKLSSVFLVALLIYDIFWVFFSSSVFDANVMVEVATRKARNPVSVVADKLNMPEVAKSRPPLSLPGKLLVPSSFDEDHFTVLGLGDIVLPGLILCLAMRFDHFGKSRGISSDGRKLPCLLFFLKQTYFGVSIVGYTIGLITASAFADLFDYPQPALLYLVPCVLIPLLLKAFFQGDFAVLWNGPFVEQPTLPI